MWLFLFAGLAIGLMFWVWFRQPGHEGLKLILLLIAWAYLFVVRQCTHNG